MAVKVESTITLVRVDDGTNGGVNLLTDTRLFNKINPKINKRYVLIYDNSMDKYLEPLPDSDNNGVATGFNKVYLPASRPSSGKYNKWVTWVNTPLLASEIIGNNVTLSFEYKMKTGEDPSIKRGKPLCIEYYLTNGISSEGTRIYYGLKYIPYDELKIFDNGMGGEYVKGWSKFELSTMLSYEYFKNTSGTPSITKEKCKYLCVRIYNNDMYDLHMRKIKFEIGNKATDWTPAQEDVDSDIENAKKTATNYLNFSDKGLIVGDMTKTSLGNNVLIDSDSVDIRNGENKLASFGANLIEIGKNNEKTQIMFCNNAGTIAIDEIRLVETGTTSSCFTMQSPNNIALSSPVIKLEGGRSGIVGETTGTLYDYDPYLILDTESAVLGCRHKGNGLNADSIISLAGVNAYLMSQDIISNTAKVETRSDVGDTFVKLYSTDEVILVSDKEPDSGIYTTTLDLTTYNCTLDNGIFKVVNNGVTIGIGALNGSCCHIYTEGNKAIAFNNDLIFSGLANIGSISNPAGNICIGNSTSGYRARNAAGNDWINVAYVSSSNNVYVGGGDSPPGAIFLKAKNMSNVFGVTVDKDGERVYSMSIYNRTYTGGSYAVLTSAGTLGRRTSSSKRYKKDIISIDDNLIKHNSENMLDDRLNTEPIIDPHNLYQIPVMQYKYIDGYLCGEDPNVGKDVIGIIAEDVAEFYPQAAIYDENGAPEAWNSEPVLVGLLYLVQEQKKEIEAIKQQLKGITK